MPRKPGMTDEVIIKMYKRGIRKHSLKVRKTINKLSNKGDIKFLMDDDPIEVYHDFLKEKAKNNKQARNQIAKHKKEMEEKLIEESKKYNSQAEIVSSEEPIRNNIEPLYKERTIKNKNTKLERFSFNS